MKDRLLTEITESINQVLRDDPQLELQVNRGHWERLLPLILTKSVKAREKEIADKILEIINEGQDQEHKDWIKTWWLVRDRLGKLRQALKRGIDEK